MSGNIMGLIGVTILAIIGTAVVAIDQLGKWSGTTKKIKRMRRSTMGE